MGAEGKPALTCLHFPLPVSCPSLLILSGGIDEGGSLKQALLAEEASWLGPVTFREAGKGPVWCSWECLGDAEVGAAFPRKMRQGGRVGWIRRADEGR